MRPLLIVLNGTSSAGKTTLATALQAQSTTPLQVSGIDSFLTFQPPSMFALPGSDTASDGFTWLAVQAEGLRGWTVQAGSKGHALMCAVHSFWATCAEQGISQVVDHVLLSAAMADDLCTRLAPHAPLYVGVRCPLDVVEQRERERGDRYVGQGRGIAGTVHNFLAYDVEVDTSTTAPEDAARTILAATSEPGRPPAWAVGHGSVVDPGKWLL